jgi:hypothetical protein
MKSPFCRACIMLALVLSLGLHWTVLQSAAWVGMVVAYSKDASFGEALEKTFDGEHPCPLCKIVETGSQTDDENDKQTAPAKIKKIDLMLATIEALVVPAPDAPDYLPHMQHPVSREYAPAVPPPRVA